MDILVLLKYLKICKKFTFLTQFLTIFQGSFAFLENALTLFQIKLLILNFWLQIDEPYPVTEFSILSWGAKLPLTLGVEMQLSQVEVRFSGKPMIRHSNSIWGTNTSVVVLHLMNRSLTTFRVVNCDAIQENSGHISFQLQIFIASNSGLLFLSKFDELLGQLR